MENKNTLALLDEMYEIAKEILRVTARLQLTGDTESQEKEVSDFHFLIEKREPMFKKLLLLKELSDKAANALPSKTFDARQKQTQQVLAQIVALDQQHLETMERIKTAVQSSLKGISSGKKLNKVYAHPLEQVTATGIFDTKQ